MPPNRFSRHRFSLGVLDDDEHLFLSERTPYVFRELQDNKQHVVSSNDTLWALAGRYFVGIPRPSGLWWVIADFQPDPILDPTIKLVEGSIVIVPSLRTVQQEILNERRKRVEFT